MGVDSFRAMLETFTSQNSVYSSLKQASMLSSDWLNMVRIKLFNNHRRCLRAADGFEVWEMPFQRWVPVNESQKQCNIKYDVTCIDGG